jgi:AraC-like DNA-binding protein
LEIVVNRLADVLFVQVLRAHIASREHPCNKGWLRAVFDPQIGLALKSLHENVAPPWTVESLAAACGMSRSAFAQKFKDLVGEAPLEYLTNWRIQKAIALLRDEGKKLFGVAKSVGYDSDAAFSKAFKRVFGVAPKRFAGNVPSVTQG